jgi:ferrochelatase
LKTLREAGLKEVVVAPIGFVSDHMEVVYDLDVEARKVAEEIGMNLVRARTAGTHPAFVKMIRELMLERITDVVPKNICAPDCCRIT